MQGKVKLSKWTGRTHRSVAQPSRHSAPARFSRHSRFEELEDRSLLTAVGYFERVDGIIGGADVFSESDAYAVAYDTEILAYPNGAFSDPPQDIVEAEMVAHSTAGASAVLGNAFANGMAQSLAEISTPIGGTIAAPSVTQVTAQSTFTYADGNDQYTWAEGAADSSVFTALRGDFVYVDTTPGQSEDFYGAIYLNAIGGGVAGGGDLSYWTNTSEMNIVVWKNDEVIAEIWVDGEASDGTTTPAPGMSYDLTGSVNGVGFELQASGLNVYVNFVTPIEDGDRITFTTQVQIDELENIRGQGIDADQYSVAFDSTAGAATAGALFLHAINAYGYATPTGTAPAPGLVQLPEAPGDLDGDGQIDEIDADLWREILAGWAEAGVDPLIVTTEADEFDGDYSIGDLSLREAIYLADQVDRPGEDVIAFAPWVTEIDMSGSQFLIGSGNNLTIAGPGSDLLTIDAQQQSRGFQINAGTDVKLRGMTITNGKVVSTSQGGGAVFNNGGAVEITDVTMVENAGYMGGAIRSTGDLSIQDSTILDNTSTFGGGVHQTGGHLEVERSIVDSNYASYYGGGIYVTAATFDINQSRLSDNRARSGGGAYAFNAAGEIRNSSVVSNSGTGGGLLLYNDGDYDVVVSNTTVSSNTSTAGGAGIYWYSTAPGLGSPATLTLVNSTVAKNFNTFSSFGAGLNVSPQAGDVILLNTILADNTSSGSASDIFGSVLAAASYNNLIGPGGSGGISNGVQGNIVLSAGQTAGLTALGNYGGPAWLLTHALLSTSAAIDAGDNAITSLYGLDFDQRGDGYDRIVDWDGDTILKSDIGAFELALGELYT